MDAREYVKIVKENCFTGRKCNECPFFVGVQCTAGVWSTGIKDPVEIAEEIKVKRDKPQLPQLLEPELPGKVDYYQGYVETIVYTLRASFNELIDYLKAKESNED